MDPHIFIARAEGQRWLSIAEKLLISQDLVGSKTFAIRARESDPRLEAADQILAIIDTLLAAEKRVIANNGTHQPDYYAILQLVRFVQSSEHISAQYRQLAFILNPNQNRFPYSEQAFHLVNDAYSVLSDPIRKSIYDSDIHYIDISQPHHYNNNNDLDNNNSNNNVGFNLELQQQSQNHHHHHHQQHNFFDPPQQMFEQQQQPPQHNFLFQQNSVRGMPGVPVRDHEELFQPHVHQFHITSTRPLQQEPAQPPPMSWAQQMLQQQQQQLNRAGENAAGNGVGEERVEIERETNDGNVDESPTFWTTCPYCLNMYEHYRAYVDCILRCENCKRAFQAVPIPSPPDVAEDQETYFCCWGYYPIGVSMMQLGKQVGENGTGVKSDWTPFSTLNDVSSQVKDRLNDNAAMKTKLWQPWVFIDDFTDDIFDGISEESSDDSDDEWRSNNKKKSKKIKRNVGHKKKQRYMLRRSGKNAENNIPVPEGEEEPMGHEAESSKKAVAGNPPRRQSGRVAKELGKLDLNVEFNNNEGEEPVPRMAAGNRGNGQGAEDNVEEGIGFFEGLDEFLSNLPILSVNDEENVKDS